MARELFHVARLPEVGGQVRYGIFADNHEFLMPGKGEYRMKRHEAYAIMRLLNSQTRALKWAEKFGDPYQ